MQVSNYQDPLKGKLKNDFDNHHEEAAEEETI
jgi:hypothetical protein